MSLRASNLVTYYKEHSHLKKIIANTFWQYFDNLFQLAVAFFIGVWVARYLGPEQYGKLNYAIYFTSLFGIFTTFTVNNVVVREIVKQPDKKNEILGSAILMKLIGFLISVSLIFLFIPIMKVPEGIERYLIAIYSVSLFFQMFSVITSWFESVLKSKFSTICSVSVFVISNIVRIYLVLHHASLIAFGFVGLLEFVLVALGLITAYRIDGQHILKWRSSPAMLKELFLHNWPSLAASIFSMFYLKLDKILVGDLVNNASLSNYSIATNLTDPLVFVATAITVSAYPSIIALKQTNEAKYQQRSRMILNFMLVLAIVIALPVTVLSKQIIGFVYGSQYYEAGMLLSIYIWSLIPAFLGAAAIKNIYAENLQKYIPARAFLAAVVSVALDFLLIPRYGATGAAFAGLSASITVNYLANGLFKATRPIFLTQTQAFFKPFLR